MGILLALFGSGIGKGLIKFLPYVLALLVVVGVYFYGHRQGTIACHEKELQAVVAAHDEKMKELQKQYEDSQRVIASLTAKNSQIRDITRVINDKIGKIPNPKGCVVGKDVIDLINQARAGAAPAPVGDKKK